MGLSDLMDAASQAPVKRRRRRSRWLVPFFLAVAVLVATVELVTHKTVLPVPEQCQADTTSGVVQLSLDQMKNASTIAARAVVKGLPVRAATVAIATAMQESQLVNLDTGDRDSIGLFQQRPSQGWGTADQISDPVYSTDAFLRALQKVPGWEQLSIADAAQAVQKSAFPQAYAQHAADAATLAAALTGQAPGALNCTMNSVGYAPVSNGTQTVASTVQHEFGGAVLVGSDGSDLVLTPSGSGSATQVGWALAQWSVAHATFLHLTSVSYDGKQWTSAASTKGWQSPTSAAASGSAAAGTVQLTVAESASASASASSG